MPTADAESPPQPLAFDTLSVGPTGRLPAQAVLLIHGTGGNGPEQIQAHRSAAEAAASAADLPVLLLAPTLEVPYHFLIPDLARRTIAALDLLREGGRIRPRVHLWGFSGGAHFAHRFALQHPDQAARVVALSAGEWTAPDGRHDGMMTRTDWFERPPFDGMPGLREAAAVPAAPGRAHLRWRVGCGDADTADRQETAAWFADALAADAEGGPVERLHWSGGHDHIPADVYARSWAFLTAP